MSEPDGGAPYPQEFIEKYELIECLSDSGRGETLLVAGRANDNYYVAKRTDGDTDPETMLLSQLSHPSLPQYVECIRTEGSHILIREYIRGTPLDEYMRERPLTAGQITNIGIQIAEVLSYLHSQSPPVIHRDVKPQNVIVSEGGRVTLIDFGIARTYKPNAKKDTEFAGTSDFAPPEQYGFYQTDARADVFSLGMLMKFLLTNGELDGDIPDRRLARIVKRCIAFSPDARYKTASAVKNALLRSKSKTPVYLAAAAALIAALAAGFLMGRYLPATAEFYAGRLARIEAQSPEEYARAVEHGFVTVDAGLKGPDKRTVTWAEYCDMLGSMIDSYDAALSPRWRELTADAPDSEIRRDGGMVALLFAGELMGLDSFNSDPPPAFMVYSPKVWNAVRLDYPIFDWNRYKMIDEGCYDDNYVGPSYDYCVRRTSNITGKSLLEFDATGDLRLEQPLTLREAALSVIRLYESAQ